MKKILFTVIAVLIAALIVTCDMFQPEETVEYTDVVYSDDGSRVTVYLDGIGVPKTQAQRAMSTRLSKMAYDYLEVIFASGTTIARAQWELGQSAGISGVARDVDYAWIGSFAAGDDCAILVAGRKDGKTLLGIGDIQEIDGSPGTVILSSTKSVTFYVLAVKTGLLVEGEDLDTDDAEGILYDSFYKATSTIADQTGAKWVDSSRTELGNQKIPTYPLPVDSGDEQEAVYKFEGAPEEYASIILFASTKKIFVEPRFPRYMQNGSYRQLSETIDMRSTVVATIPTNFSNEIELTFTTKGNGIFSFYIEIPVYILTTAPGTNSGTTDPLKPIAWKIRTGLGSELYSLDDGLAGGGCVLMSIGKLSLEDWLEIQWKWEDEI